MTRHVIGIQSSLCALLVIISWTWTAQAGEAGGKESYLEEATKPALLHREKRQLLFSNASLFQLVVGVTVPTPAKDIRCNWAFQANFDLPTNRTQIPTDIFLANSGYEGDSRALRAEREIEDEEKEDKGGLLSIRVKMEHEEGTDNQLNEISAATADDDIDVNTKQDKITPDLYGLYKSESRLLHLYKGIEKMLDSFGYEGSPCVLRTLCQLAEEPLHTEHDEDVLHELASFVLDPNNDQSDMESKEDHPYLEAFARGRASEDCRKHYAGCTLNVVDVITAIKHD